MISLTTFAEDLRAGDILHTDWQGGILRRKVTHVSKADLIHLTLEGGKPLTLHRGETVRVERVGCLA